MIEGEDRYARLAARVLRGARESLGQPEDAPLHADVRRDAVVAAMALAIAAKARRRRILTLTAVTLAAAASLLVALRLTGNGGLSGAKPGESLALVVEQATGQGNQLVRATTMQPLPVLGVLAVGDSVRSSKDGSATLGFANGTRITLSSSANLRVDDLGSMRRFSLFHGTLRAHVAKLGPGERFVVSTPDSEVEVRGTVFTVGVDSSPGRCRGSTSQSSVHVSEGAVWVRSGDMQVVLHPGESWATPCPESSKAAPAAVETPEPVPALAPSPAPAAARLTRSWVNKPAVANEPGPVAPAPAMVAPVPTRPSESPLVPGAAPAPSEKPAPPAAVSRLAEENDLFSAALDAERQGQHDLALRRLDDLIARYPGGPLNESARAERQRILLAP
jgi:hypothetical protein